MREHRLEVLRTARFYTLGPRGTPLHEAWFVLHGYRQLASRFLRRFEVLDDGTRLLVAPEALSRFYVDPSPGRHGSEARVGATWMTREDRLAEIGDYVRYLDAVLEAILSELPEPPARVVVLGFSQGCHTAARWTVLGRVRPARLFLWGDYLPHDLPEAKARERLGSTGVTVVHGRRDPSLRSELMEAHEARLRALGVRFEHVLYDGGHEIEAEPLLRLAGGVVQNSPMKPISGTSS